MAIVDASVWVALLHGGDRFHRRCTSWLESALLAGEGLAAPTLLEVEAAAALRRLTGDEKLARGALDLAAGLTALEYVPLTTERAASASRAALEASVRGADAVYLDLARERRDLLITLDRQQLERGGSIAEVRRPE